LFQNKDTQSAYLARNAKARPDQKKKHHKKWLEMRSSGKGTGPEWPSAKTGRLFN